MNEGERQKTHPGAGPSGPDRPDELDILDVRFLVIGLWRGKWIVLVFAILGGVLAFQSFKKFSPTYVASMVVLPSGQEFNQSGRVSGLAQSLGISVADGPASSFDRFKLLLNSMELAQHLQDKYGLFDLVFGSARNAETGQWEKPTGRRFEVEQRIRRTLQLKVWRPPALEDLASYLGGSIIIGGEKSATAFQRISFEHRDSEFALWVLETVYVEADSLLRDQDRQEAESKKKYLREQLASATIAESRSMLAGLLEGEERRLMLMAGDFSYASRVIQAPRVSKEPTTANLRQNFFLPWFGAILFGALLAFGLAIARRD